MRLVVVLAAITNCGGVVPAVVNQLLVFGAVIGGFGRTRTCLDVFIIGWCGDSAQRHSEEESYGVDTTTDEPYVHFASNVAIGPHASDL